MLGARRLPLVIRNSRGYHHGYSRKGKATLMQKAKVYSAVAAVGGLGYFIYASNLSTVPITGRRQFMLYLPEDDLDLGKRELARLLDAVPACEDAQAKQVLEIVSSAIAREVDAMGLEFEWEFHLLDTADVNAMCLPGGKVVVFVGLLKALYLAQQGSEINNFADALAFVIAHEIGHAVARHGMEKMSTVPFLGVVQVLFNTSPLLSWLESYTLDLPMSRTMETEADIIGMELMARACFNPAEAANVQMMLDDSPAFLEYFRTHPVGSTRKRACDDHLESAIKTASEHCVVCCDSDNKCRLVKLHVAEAMQRQHQSLGWFTRWLCWILGTPQPSEPVIVPVDPAFWHADVPPVPAGTQLSAKKRRKGNDVLKRRNPSDILNHKLQSAIHQLLKGDNAITRQPQQDSSSAKPQDKH